MRALYNPASVFGLLLVAGSVAWGWQRITQLPVSTEGRVVEVYQYDRGTKRNSFFYPVVEFTTESGERVRFRAGAGLPREVDPDFQIGEPVPVVYDPADPAGAQIDRFMYRWLGPLGMAMMGFSLVAMGVWTATEAAAKARRAGDGN